MGQAEIISGGTDGLYRVRLDYGTETRDKRVEKLTADLATVQGKLDTAESELADQQAIVSSQQGELDGKISAYETAAKSLDALRIALDEAIQDRLGLSENATPEEIAAANAAVTAATSAYNAAETVIRNSDKEINDALKKLEKEKSKVYPLQLKVDLLTDEKTGLTKKKKYWTDLTLQEEKNVWCADVTEDATGKVATLEIPGENNMVVIKPGAPAHTDADGKLVARAIQHPNQAFFNAAILPGWQKYLPTYRRGTITELDTELDTASVTLADDKSSAQNLGINKVSELKNVPVKYMECNASAFEVGDTVVVQFDDQSWGKPKITGFVREPKPCGLNLQGIQASETHYGGADVDKPSSSWVVAYAKDMPDDPKPESAYADHPGHITWSSPHFKIGSKAVELSWRGPDDRYSSITGWTKHTGGYISLMIPGTSSFIEKIGAPKGSAGSIPLANCYIDTEFVWINGRRVGTGVKKVIAASLHRPNPDVSDGVVLRVLSDSYPQNTGTRRFCTFDIIPSDASGPVPLSAIIAATSFKIHATWPATLFDPSLSESGSWYNEQRPHFDNRGERVATSIIKQGEQTRYQVHAVSLDPVTWQILEEFSPLGQNTDARTSSAEVTGSKEVTYPGGYVGVEITAVSFQISRTYNGNYYVLYAVDFLNDDFVYVYHEMQSSGSEHEVGSGSITKFGDYSGADTYSKSNTIALTINHSIHGVIAQRTHTSTEYGGVGFDGENATISSTTDTEFIWDKTQLCADLSRDVFAIGVPRPNKYEINYSGPAEIIDNMHSDELRATVSVTTTNSQIEYDVFIGGHVVVSGTNGDFAMPQNTDTIGTTFISDGYPDGIMMVANNNISLPHSYNITSPTYLQSSGIINASNEACKNIAVRPDGKAAYFGVNALDAGGLELLVVKNKDGTGTVIKDVPPYIDGTHPTIACPVFGYRRK